MKRDLPPVPHQSAMTEARGSPSRIWSAWFEQISNITSEKSASGYQRLPGGLIVQWGITASVSTGDTESVSFPTEFPTGCLQVLSGLKDVGATATTETGHHGTGNYSTTGFDLYNRTSIAAVFNWFAVGH